MTTDTYPKTIPWVTRWTGEVVTHRPFTVHPLENRVMFNDGEDEDRDGNGVLWRPEGINRSGKPEFSQVNSHRQRACMIKRLCQVCGKKITSEVIRWLMVDMQLEQMGDGSTCTMSPPTCDDCIPVALALCPALGSRPYVINRVLEYEPWGYSGELALYDKDMQLHRRRDAAIPLGSPLLRHMLAKQMVVKFTKFTPEKT